MAESRERQELKDHRVVATAYWFQTICCGCALVATLFSRKPDWLALVAPVGGQLICLYYIHEYVKGIRKP